MADGMSDMTAKPTEDISVREVFGIDSDMAVSYTHLTLPTNREV